jgi:DnaJ like chaperone protein
VRSLLEAFEVLGLPVTASRDEVERAFRSRSLTCHPDKVAHLDEEFRVLAERKFKRLVEAHQLVVATLSA